MHLVSRNISLFIITFWCVVRLGQSRPTTRANFMPYAEAGTREDGKAFAGVGALNVGEEGFNVGFGELGVESHKRKLGGKVEVTGLRAKFGNDNANLDAKFLTASLDAGIHPLEGALMGRAALFDHTVKAGPVDINYGVVADTGSKFDGRNFEAKFLGIGGKLGADGIQACFIFCFGINWG